MKSLVFGGVLLTAFAAAPALAQSADPGPARSVPLPRVVPPATEGITVTASRLPRIVRTFVDAATMPSPIGQVSRWKTPICPKTTGMRPALANFVTKRVREIARDVGAPVDPNESCAPNLQILVTPRPQEQLDAIRIKFPGLLGFHFVREAEKLATVTRPIQAWYATGTRDLTGELEADDPYDYKVVTVAHSLLLTGRRSEFTAVTVVVDLVAIQNQEIGAVADHVAMLGLSQPKTPERCREVPSITNMLIDCPLDLKAIALSRFDRAYLKALYAITDSDVRQRMLNADIASKMRKILEADPN